MLSHTCAMQINCRVPFPERFMHRRRGWRDTPTLIQYEPDAPPGDNLIPFFSPKHGYSAFVLLQVLPLCLSIRSAWHVPVKG